MPVPRSFPTTGRASASRQHLAFAHILAAPQQLQGLQATLDGGLLPADTQLVQRQQAQGRAL